MDINSLLSPQETPRATPSPQAKASTRKPRKPKASRLGNATQSSPLSNTTPAPPTIPNNVSGQLQHAIPSPTVTNPALLRKSSSGTASADANIISRQPSTPGMDTLADLASMQHHQQAARANAGGLRSAEIYENPTPSSGAVVPSLHLLSKAPVAVLRGGSHDVPMMDSPDDSHSPRTYSTSSLSETDLQAVAQLVSYLASHHFDYESHVQLINLLHQGFVSHTRSRSSSIAFNAPHTYDLLPDLQSARETMNTRFALGEELWVDWIEDQKMLANSLEDRISVIELCQKAVDEETCSTRLWLLYGQWMLSLYKNAHAEDEKVLGHDANSAGHTWSEEDRVMAREVFSWPQMMNVWKRGAQETTWQLSDSHLVWDQYTELMLQELASSPSQDAIAGTQYHFVNRLQTPHASWDQTFQAYSSFVSKYDSANYEITMVTATRLGASAKSKYDMRELFELGILRARQENNQQAEMVAYGEYIDWEMAQKRKKQDFDFDLANALHQRFVLQFPARAELWETYAMFLTEEITAGARRNTSLLPMLEMATRHCPWSGTLWAQHLLAAEISRLPFTDIQDIKNRATSTGLLDASGMEEVLKVHTAWCGFLRRRAFHEDSTDEDMDVAEVGIRSAIEDMEDMGQKKYGKDYQGDPEYRLEKIYIKYLTQCRNWQGARESFKKLTRTKGDSYEFWIRYYAWEMATWCKLAYRENDPDGGRPVKPTEATKVLQQALKRPNLDWPEKIIETFRYHCEDHEDAEELQSSVAQVWRAKNAVQKRREKEAYDAYETAQADALQQRQHTQHDISYDQGDNMTNGKRKREDFAEGGSSKRSRPDDSEGLQVQSEEQNSLATSLPKRDRENATIVVKNLPLGTNETKLRQYFRDCGTINSLKLMPEANGEAATASIEFNSKEDVLTAQTKDMKMFEGNAIQIQIGSGTTLYVCNFPPTADESWVREKFQEYGDIVDIRFPSLKYNTHRRFCYVQFKSSADAKAATQLDGEALGGKLKLVAKTSDPGHRQERQGALYEGRELYLANLDWSATKSDVRKAFSKYGTVENVRIPKKIDGTGRGIGYVVFSNKDDTTAALEMNLVRFKNRILNVSMSTNDATQRRANRIITSNSPRSTVSPAPEPPADGDGSPLAASSPSSLTQSIEKSIEIQSRTIALLNIPDTVNDARIRALAEPYGEIVKILLQPGHQGAILEFKEVASVGKASLGLEGHEVVPGRKITVSTVKELKLQKAEKKIDRIGAKKSSTSVLQPPTNIRRPNQPGARRGGKGSLGVKRGGAGGGETEAKARDDEDERAVKEEKPKSNADFKALFLKK